MTQRIAVATLLAAGVVLGAGAASAQTSIDLNGAAPLVCHAGISGSGGSSSQIDEFCNDPEGYGLFLDYPTSLAGSTVTVNGQAVTLTDSGTVEIASSAGPDAAQQSFSISPTPSGSVTFTVRMEPVDAASYAQAATN